MAEAVVPRSPRLVRNFMVIGSSARCVENRAAHFSSSSSDIPTAKRDKVYYAPRDGATKDNYVAKTGAMA